MAKPDDESLKKLWETFPDAGALESRAQAYRNNGCMQPIAAHINKGMLAVPALYDWINVSLTLTDQQELPKISVPPWKNQEI
jgi:hypothetical protein